MEIINPITKEKTYIFPVGYRFQPNDDDLVSYYLRKKILREQLPEKVIQEHDVFGTEPWGLPGDEEEMNYHKFMFYKTSDRVFENPDKRVVGTGQWRIVEKGQDVELPTSPGLIGKKNILVFWKAKGKRFTKTKWTMHELQLAPKSNPSSVSDWAVYRVFQMGVRMGIKSKTKRSRGETSNSNKKCRRG